MAISSSSNNVSDARLKQFDDASGLVAKEPRILEGASSGGLRAFRVLRGRYAKLSSGLVKNVQYCQKY